jgi:hypothetical protein
MGVGNVEVGIVSYSKAIIPVDPSRGYTCDCLRCLKLCLDISLFLRTQLLGVNCQIKASHIV